MIVGCYSMHLYCDTGNDMPGMPGDYGKTPHNFENPGRGEFIGHSESECKKQARMAGWRFTRDRRVICPSCNT